MVSNIDKGAGGRPLFLNIDEVSMYLSVETELITKWVENGKFPGMREGEIWKFEKDKVDEWIANGRII